MRTRKTRSVLTRSGPLLLAAGLALSACGGSGGPSTSADVVISTPPAGYTLGPSNLNGHYSLSLIAQASPVPSSQASKHLHTAGVGSGYGHVFVAGNAYVVLIVMRARNAAAASRLASTETAAATGMFGTASWQPQVVPGAHGYLFNGTVKGASAFCQGAWVSYGAYAFHAYTCNDRPGTVATLETVMRAEYQLLQQGSG